MSIVEAFERAAAGLAGNSGFPDLEVVFRSARRARGTTELSLTIDQPGGVDISLCERVAAEINGALESEPDPYTLAVESAGLERPLLAPRDYERFAGKAVKVVSNSLIEAAKTHRGTLLGLRGEGVVIDVEGRERLIPLTDVKTANLQYDVRADLERQKREKQRT